MSTNNTTTEPITTKQQLISPKRAGEILDRHYQRVADGLFLQRPITENVIARYASDMKLGNWKLSPQPIAFDTNGDLIDGQHRLEAVRKSGKDIPMMVSTGWPIEDTPVKLIDVIDTGKVRTISQMLHLHGFKNANNYASCARFAGRVAWLGGNPLTTYSGAAYLLDGLNLRAAVDRIVSQTVARRDFQGRTVGPLAYYWTAHPNKAMSFAEDLFNHTATKGSAIHTYFKWIANARRQTDEHLKGFCACLRAWHNNTEISFVRMNQEAIEWLAGTNPKLREQIRAAIPRSK